MRTKYDKYIELHPIEENTDKYSNQKKYISVEDYNTMQKISKNGVEYFIYCDRDFARNGEVISFRLWFIDFSKHCMDKNSVYILKSNESQEGISIKEVYNEILRENIVGIKEMRYKDFDMSFNDIGIIEDDKLMGSIYDTNLDAIFLDISQMDKFNENDP